MVDQFLLALRDLSQTLIPFAALLVLVFLAKFLWELIVLLKKLPRTLEEVNALLETTNESVEKLEKPLDTLGNVSETVDTVNQTTMDVVKSIASYTYDHRDVIVNWFKKDEDKPEKTEEDFGIYE